MFNVTIGDFLSNFVLSFYHVVLHVVAQGSSTTVVLVYC
jgi:hypothetical protein